MTILLMHRPSLESNAEPVVSTPDAFPEVDDAISPVTPRVLAISDSEDDWDSLPAIPPRLPAAPKPSVETTIVEDEDKWISLPPPLPVRTSRRAILERAKSSGTPKEDGDSIPDDFDWELFWKDSEEESKKPPLPSAPKPKLDSRVSEGEKLKTNLSSEWSDEVPGKLVLPGRNQTDWGDDEMTMKSTSRSERDLEGLEEKNSKTKIKRDPQILDEGKNESHIEGNRVSRKSSSHPIQPLDDWSDELPVSKPTHRQSFNARSRDKLSLQRPANSPPKQKDWSDDELPVKTSVQTRQSLDDWSDDELPVLKSVRLPSAKKNLSNKKSSVRKIHPQRPLSDWSDDELPVKKRTQSLSDWSDDSDLPAMKPTRSRRSQTDWGVRGISKESSRTQHNQINWDIPRKHQATGDGLSTEEERPNAKVYSKDINNEVTWDDESSSDWPMEARPAILKENPENEVFDLFNGYDFSKQPMDTVKPLSVSELMSMGAQEKERTTQVEIWSFIES